MCVEKCYRPNVAAIILSSKYPLKCEFFIARRKDLKNVWQFPQGGIDKGETPKEALLRELKEEIGCDHVNIIAEYPHWITYDFPNVVSSKMYPFDGQRQKYFLVRLKKGAKINLSADGEPEFREWKYVNYEMMLKKITYYKRQNYIKVIEHFVKEGYI